MDSEADLQQLATKLSTLGMMKGSLPFGLHGWVNALGLHIQLTHAGRFSKLQAGGSLRAYLDAVYDNNDEEPQWHIEKFDRRTWEARFAHLVEPTQDIVSFFVRCLVTERGVSNENGIRVQRAVKQYKLTGKWMGLPSG